MPMCEGWIKIHRQMMDKAYYKKDSERVHLWLHLLLKASHDKREEVLGGKMTICQPGQFTTGRKQLSEETGISESKVERILTYFEKNEQQIEQRKTSVNRLISIINWSEYQQSEQRPNNEKRKIEQRSEQRKTAVTKTKSGSSNGVKTKSEQRSEQRKSEKWTHYKNIILTYYNTQIETAKLYAEKYPEAQADLENYKRFILFISDWENIKKVDPLGNSIHRPFTQLLDLKEQLSFQDFVKHYARAKELKKDFYDVLRRMENHDSIRKRKSFNLTLYTWINDRGF